MPTDPKVTLTVWRDAKTDPPEDDSGMKLTDQGDAYYEAEDRTGEWGQAQPSGWYYSHEPHLDDIRLDPQPERWCDPRPPVESEHGPLTMDDLRTAADALEYASGNGAVIKSQCRDAAARLRRAIEDAER